MNYSKAQDYLRKIGEIRSQRKGQNIHKASPAEVQRYVQMEQGLDNLCYSFVSKQDKKALQAMKTGRARTCEQLAQRIVKRSPARYMSKISPQSLRKKSKDFIRRRSADRNLRSMRRKYGHSPPRTLGRSVGRSPTKPLRYTPKPVTKKSPLTRIRSPFKFKRRSPLY